MKKHILLIDDDKDELMIFMDALSKVPHDEGFKCTFAGSGRQAIEMLKYLVPDYIFSDFNMHEMNGIELLRYIKERQPLNKTELCLYSGHIDAETARKAAMIGVHCIQKTGTIASLAKNLSRLFAMERQPRYSFSNIL